MSTTTLIEIYDLKTREFLVDFSVESATPEALDDAALGAEVQKRFPGAQVVEVFPVECGDVLQLKIKQAA